MLIISTHCSFLCLPLQIIDLQVFKVPYHIFVFFSIGSIALVCFMNGKREHSMGKYSYKIEHTLILSWKYNFFEGLSRKETYLTALHFPNQFDHRNLISPNFTLLPSHRFMVQWKFYLFIHSFNKYWVSIHFAPGIVICAGTL